MVAWAQVGEAGDARAHHHHLGRLLQLHTGDNNIAHLLLWPANSTLVRPRQGDSSYAECLIVPMEQIMFQQALVKVA